MSGSWNETQLYLEASGLWIPNGKFLQYRNLAESNISPFPTWGVCVCVSCLLLPTQGELHVLTSLASSILNGLCVFVGMYLDRGWSQLSLHTLEQNLENDSQEVLNLGWQKVFLKG